MWSSQVQALNISTAALWWKILKFKIFEDMPSSLWTCANGARKLNDNSHQLDMRRPGQVVMSVSPTKWLFLSEAMNLSNLDPDLTSKSLYSLIILVVYDVISLHLSNIPWLVEALWRLICHPEVRLRVITMQLKVQPVSFFLQNVKFDVSTCRQQLGPAPVMIYGGADIVSVFCVNCASTST